MTEELYLKDSYIREFEAKVLEIDGNKVILDRTAFYPGGGGLENDVGYFIYNDRKIEVTKVYKENGKIIHEVKEVPFKVNDKIIGLIDWERRYRMMRLHTASHIISAIAYKEYNALITGGNITPEYARDDLSLNLSGDELRNTIDNIIQKANEIIKKNINVKIYFLKREEALKIPGIVKLAERMPPNIDIWRIVEIEGIDIQADGGPHVKNTSEIGEIKLLKIENRGKEKKRIYYTV